ncbi:MAG: spore coat associated protein CotJA [Clostridia bacterium]|nr:spore coat associated protein CotJA [Clostridia bacterium]
MSDCNMEGRQLAMVYSPMQCWRMLKTPADALMSGTLFEELVKPYEEEW